MQNAGKIRPLNLSFLYAGLQMFECCVCCAQLFELMNFLMENFVFTYIGVSTFTFNKHNWDAGFICLAFVSLFVQQKRGDC